MLGSFEEMVLLAVLHQGDHAYGVSIRRELSRRSESEVSMGAVYTTLDRLEQKGFVRQRRGEPTASRRGRPRQYYDVLPEGIAALDETRRIRSTMWEGVELPAVDPGGTR